MYGKHRPRPRWTPPSSGRRLVPMRDGDCPLVLGGHSFIHQLGSDPPLDAEGQRELVAACLDAGIERFDTTYQPERLALGDALEDLGRADEARVIGWNFFRDFGPGDEPGGPRAYRTIDLELMREQLRISRIDDLVVHPVGDDAEQAVQLATARGWQEQGRVERLGLWLGPHQAAWLDRPRDELPYQFLVTPAAADDGLLAAAGELGWEIYLTSPYGRGHHLDTLVAAASGEDHRPRVADLLLRRALFRPGVDRVIVQMRRLEWIAANLASVARGPLDDAETSELRALEASP